MVNSANKIAWLYTDDNGDQWRVAATKALTDQAKLGGAAAAATVKRLPKHIKMRKRYVASAGGIRRAVVCYTKEAAMWATPDTTITLVTGGADVVFTRTNTFYNERQRDTCSQSA